MNYATMSEAFQKAADGVDRMAGLVGQESGLEADVKALADRARLLREDRFRILVLGEFKRGKSTLLNAILGADVLPRKVTPCTAIVTVIEYGEVPKVRVSFNDGAPDDILLFDEFRGRYELQVEDSEVVDSDGRVREDGPRIDEFDRFSRVEHATVSYPIELCRHRVDVVDSPGLGEHETRTRRVLGFLSQADAVVLVLDATQLLTQEETHFLESVLLGLGLRNIFFVINRWNVLESQFLNPGERAKQVESLNHRIERALRPLCVVDGRDLAARRIFRIDALGALRARTSPAPDAALLAKTGVPDLEAALERFLAEDRFRARADVLGAALESSRQRLHRYVAAQVALGEKTIEEIEAQHAGLAPMFEHLRRIREHVVEYLAAQSAVLQERLVKSFQAKIKAVAEGMPDEVDRFGLSELTRGCMLWKMVTDWARDDKDKFAKKVEAHLTPKLTRHLEDELGRWRTGEAAQIVRDSREAVEKYLRTEVEESLAIIREIDDKLGIEASIEPAQALIDEWLGGEFIRTDAAMDSGSVSVGVLGDLSALIAGLIADISLHFTINLIPVIGLIITGFRLALRETSVRRQMKDKIVEGVREAMDRLVESNAQSIRSRTSESLGTISQRFVEGLDSRIAETDNSIKAILARKTDVAYSAAAEKERLGSLVSAVDTQVEEVRCGLSVPSGAPAVSAPSAVASLSATPPAPEVLTAGSPLAAAGTCPGPPPDGRRDPFARKEIQAAELLEEWERLGARYLGRLGSRAEKPVADLRAKLTQELERLSSRLRNPQLILATAGTTSGGKSTLVNMLCGREIMPVSVGEKSAGVVTIHHAPERRLKIHKTRDATWPCGEWDDPTDEQIRDRLDRLMDAYNDVREHSNAPACPLVDLDYPTRFGAEMPKLGLPPGCSCWILDLPGLKFTGDTGNAQVIKASKEALCFVTYNSLETDTDKQKFLLNQVVNQVKELGGSPVRMVFILNKIDVFRANRDWRTSEEKFCARTREQIAEAIAKELKEFAQDVTRLKIVKLSSAPALYSLIMRDGAPAERLAAAQYVDQFFSFLLPRELKRLEPEEWKDQDFEQAADALWRDSYGGSFERMLEEHIRSHFPALVIPQVVDDFINEAGQEVAQWASMTASAELNRAGEAFEKEVKRIEKAREDLIRIRERAENRLLEPFREIQGGLKGIESNETYERAVRFLTDKIKDIEEKPPFDQTKGALAPLHDWMAVGPMRAVTAVLYVTVDALTHPGHDVFKEIEDLVPPRALRNFRSALEKLAAAGYTASVAENGWPVRTTNPSEKAKVRAIRDALVALQKALEGVFEEATRRASQLEIKRIFAATQGLLSQHTLDIADQAARVAPGFGLNVKPSTLDLVHGELVFEFELTSDFEVTQQMVTRYKTTITKTVERTGFWGRIRDWFGKTTVSEDVYENVEELRAEVPDASDIAAAWEIQAKAKRGGVMSGCSNWLIEQIEAVNQSIGEYHETLLARYHERLDQVHSEARDVFDDDQEYWLGVNESARLFTNLLNDLRRLSTNGER